MIKCVSCSAETIKNAEFCHRHRSGSLVVSYTHKVLQRPLPTNPYSLPLLVECRSIGILPNGPELSDVSLLHQGSMDECNRRDTVVVSFQGMIALLPNCNHARTTRC